ncbi:hypothetical protein [Agromyces sp. NPDC058104]|uniref:hypothetical protein n=1 Tax=Agromyces sp. NPDC058104 TaxID=3346342 RepID=UPI0036DB0EE0
MTSPSASTRFRGLTWDHPRGRAALEAAAAASPGLISWDAHSLEGFESAPIDDLARRYDVIVLDHPHLGDALATDSLRPLGELFDREWLDALEGASVGPSLASYRLGGDVWALPLDAATQVAALLPERVRSAPRTWGEVLALSHHEPVALSLAGPHAFLTFASLCVALGEEPRTEPGSGFVSEPVAERALSLLRDLAGRAPEGSALLNPIGLLERMRRDRDLSYVPLVYGYVNYTAGDDGLRFADAPAARQGSRRGSTIGGTGLAISRRAAVDDELLEHLRRLLDPVVQAGFIPDHEGQPSARSAWLDERVNAASRSFYRATLKTIESAWVRPRVAGFTAFQSEASELVRKAVIARADARAAIRELDRRFDALAREGALR